MITIQLSQSPEDLQDILSLQQANLSQHIPAQEQQREGFVRVKHELHELESLHLIEPHVIAREGSLIAAYILAMTKASRDSIPMLVPMFGQFDSLEYNGKKVSEYNYMTVGQVCVGKGFRGQGLFEECYRFYRSVFSPKYDFAITEISLRNTRSIRAHEKVGFQTIHLFQDEYEEWAIVLWDWRGAGSKS